jgi:hypothetical protein
MTAFAPLALWIGTSALQAAPTQAQQDAIRSSCQSDYRTYCASVPTGGSAALQCLEKNVASLSSACQQAVRAATGGSAASSSSSSSTTTAPAASGGSSSATAPASGGAASGQTAASSAPAVIVIQPGQEIALMREACGSDYRAHCAGVRIIGGGALQCLVSHASSLSQSCKSELGKLGQKF